MKSKCNLFGLLTRGVTTTHPLCSVFIVAFVFVFCSFSVSVRASVSNIPELNDWQFQQAIYAYSSLTDDQKDIANFLTGSQGYAFAGIANSNLNSNFNSFSETIESAKNYGAKMWDQISSFGTGVANNMLGVTNDLSNFFASAVTYAKTRSESFSAWLGNVGIDYNSSSEFRVQFGKDQAKDNIDFIGDEGLYNWQNEIHYILPSDFVFVYDFTTMNTSQIEQYYRYYATLSQPIVQSNYSNRQQKNEVYASISFDTYKYIFVNTTEHVAYICDSYGNRPVNNKFSAEHLFMFQGGIYLSNNDLYLTSFDVSSYSSMRDVFIAINNNPRLIINENGRAATAQCILNLSDFIEGLFVGPSWENKVPMYYEQNLNLTPTSQYVTVNSPTNVIYIDLNGFMKDLYDNQTIIYNYVIDNSVDNNGDPVDSGDFSPISKFVTIPPSGINIGADFFKLPGSELSIFDTYIADLWRNTKGMVLYCADILSVFTPDEGVGLAYIVYGGIAVGVIGGIFSKFLL